MGAHLKKELDGLRRHLLRVSSIVETNLQKTLAIFSGSAIDLAELKEADHEIDILEVEVEEECLKLLALHQPVASDLRYIICILKMNNDLERIGDLALNIAKKAKKMLGNVPENEIAPLLTTGETALLMLCDSITALVNSDTNLAREVCARDDAVDDSKSAITARTITLIKQTPAMAESYIAMLGAVRNLERIADLATNLCEDIVYSETGEIIRHGRDLV